MKIYFDTNVLVAALITSHPHHPPAYAALARVHAGEITGCIAAHGLAELYSVLTRAPLPSPVYPDEALALIAESIQPVFHIVDLSTPSYFAAIQACGAAGWKGRRVHDAVHLQAARQAACDRIYTFNLADFRALAPDLASLIQTPQHTES